LDDQVEKKAWSLERLGLLAEKSEIQDQLEDSNLRHKHALREIDRLSRETQHAARDEADAKDARMYVCLVSVSDCPMSSLPFLFFACMAELPSMLFAHISARTHGPCEMRMPLVSFLK